MTAAIYIAMFIGIVAAIAGTSMLLWRGWIASMPSPPNWQEAFRFLWVDLYGMPWEQRPRVIWVAAPFVSGGRMVSGKADIGAVTVVAASRVSDTSLAHELWHEARRLTGLFPDPDHLTDWSFVDRAQAALRERGL